MKLMMLCLPSYCRKTLMKGMLSNVRNYMSCCQVISPRSDKYTGIKFTRGWLRVRVRERQRPVPVICGEINKTNGGTARKYICYSRLPHKPQLRMLHTSGRAEHTDDNPGEKIEKEHHRKGWGNLLTIPNFLTSMRIALTPYLGYLVINESYEMACGLFFIAGLTDLLDGWIARRFPSQSSPMGSFMDPLADKFLISTLFITLTVVNLLPVPLTSLVVARDVSLIAAAFYVRIISLPPPVTLSAVLDLSNPTAELKPTRISKINTAIQLGLVVATLGAPVFNYVDHPALQMLWLVTAGTTVWSGIGYIFAKGTFQVFNQRRRKREY